jgi:hypothetical protein
MTTEFSKKNHEAFLNFLVDYAKKVPHLSDPDLPIELRYAIRKTIQDVFDAGYAAAYADYTVARLMENKGTK